LQGIAHSRDNAARRRKIEEGRKPGQIFPRPHLLKMAPIMADGGTPHAAALFYDVFGILENSVEMRKRHRRVDGIAVLDLNRRPLAKPILFEQLRELLSIKRSTPFVLPMEPKRVVGVSDTHRIGDAQGRHMIVL
jgi:hypothetical protein